MIELSKDWCAQGTEIDAFEATVNEFDKMARCTHVAVDDITWWYLVKPIDLITTGSNVMMLQSLGLAANEQQMEHIKRVIDEGDLVFLRFNPNGHFLWQHAKKEAFLKQGYTPREMRDIQESGMLISIDTPSANIPLRLCPLSPLAFDSLLNRLGLGCDAMLGNTLQRYISLCLFAFNSNTPIQLVRRRITNDDGTMGRQMAFAAMSKRYAYIPAHSLIEAKTGIENALKQTATSLSTDQEVCSLHHWRVSQEFVEAMYDLDNIKREINDYYVGLAASMPSISSHSSILNDWMPGIRIQTSDIGESSWFVEAYWRKGNTTLTGRTVKKRHIGEVNTNSLIEEAQKSLFSEFTLLPDKLIKLSFGQISDPLNYAREMMEAPEFAKLGKRDRMGLLTHINSALSTPGAYWTEYSIIETAMQVLIESVAKYNKAYVQRGVYNYILRITPRNSSKQSVTIAGLN